MTLTKCIECGQEISTEARACPHCGKSLRRKSSIAIPLFISIILCVGLIWSVHVYTKNPSGIKNLFQSFSLERTLSNQTINQIRDNIKKVPMQEVNNLGYTFYLGEIETSGSTNITDDLKNKITKIAYDTKFPKSILRETPIVIINNLALSSDLYIPTAQGNLKVPELGGHFLSEGGLYAQYTNTGASVIYLNKSTLTQGRLTDVLAHEFGHAVGNRLTDQEWSRFYQLRNIPAGTNRMSTSWNLSPTEDFAEVYKNIFTGIAVRTYFGFLEPVYGMDMGSCQKISWDLQTKYSNQDTDPDDPFKSLFAPRDYSKISSQINNNPQMQACRREVMTNPSTHQTDWQYGVPYKGSVGPMTKDFITQIVNKL